MDTDKPAERGQLVDQTENRVFEISQRSEIFQGPLPHPEIMRQYKEVDASFPDRIVKMTENYGEHSREIEKMLVSAAIENERKGRIFAFILSLVALSASFLLLLFDKKLEGAGVFITSVGVIVGAFLHSKKQDKEVDTNHGDHE